MKYIVVITLLCIVTLAGLAAIGWRRATAWRATAERETRNVEALAASVDTFRLRDSLAAVRVQDLELTRRELERLRSEDAVTIADMGVELRRLRSMTKVTTTATITGDAPTTITTDTATLAPVYTAHAADRWHTLDVEAREDTTRYTFTLRDSVVVLLHRTPHRFLWWRWGTKRLTTSVASLCPYVTRVGAETIDITTRQ